MAGSFHLPILENNLPEISNRLETSNPHLSQGAKYKDRSDEAIAAR